MSCTELLMFAYVHHNLCEVSLTLLWALIYLDGMSNCIDIISQDFLAPNESLTFETGNTFFRQNRN